jgi:hypothetical protein
VDRLLSALLDLISNYIDASAAVERAKSIKKKGFLYKLSIAMVWIAITALIVIILTWMAGGFD